MGSVGVKKDKVLVYFSLFLINLYYGLNGTYLLADGGFYILIAGLLIAIVQILFNGQFRIKEMLLLILLFLLFFVNYLQYGDSRILALLIVVCSLTRINKENILKFIFWERLIICGVIIILSLFAIIPSQVLVSERGARYSFGYQHPNQLMVTVIVILFLYICCYWKKITSLHFVAFFLILFLFQMFTRSQTGMIVGGVVLFFLLMYKYFGVEKLFVYLGRILPIALFVLSIFLPLTTSRFFTLFFLKGEFGTIYSNFVLNLDNALSHRLTLSRLTLINSRIGLFGSEINENVLSQFDYTTVDSGYVQTLLVFGIIGTILFIVLNMLMVNYFIKNKQFVFLITFIGISLYAFSENIYCSLQYNFILLFWSEIIFRNKIKIRGKKYKKQISE